MNVHPNNKPQAFIVDLLQPLYLKGPWEVALSEIHYPNNWNNITEESVWKIEITREIRVTVPVSEDDSQMRETITEVKREFTVHFFPGNYETMEHLCKAVSKSINEVVFAQCRELRAFLPIVKLFYQDFNHKVLCTHIDLIKVGIVKPQQGTQLLKALGFLVNNEPLRSHFFFDEEAPFDAVITPNYPALFVYCDIVEYQSVGDTKAPLIRTVPMLYKDNLVSSNTFIKPYYHPVKKDYIKQIEIELRNDTGALVQFQTGKSILVLHFRRCSLII